MSTDRNVASSSRNIPEHKSIAAVEPVHVFPAATHDNFSVEFPVTACNLVTIDLVDSLGKLG
jgi:ribosomal protein L4